MQFFVLAFSTFVCKPLNPEMCVCVCCVCVCVCGGCVGEWKWSVWVSSQLSFSACYSLTSAFKWCNFEMWFSIIRRHQSTYHFWALSSSTVVTWFLGCYSYSFKMFVWQKKVFNSQKGLFPFPLNSINWFSLEFSLENCYLILIWCI